MTLTSTSPLRRGVLALAALSVFGTAACAPSPEEEAAQHRAAAALTARSLDRCDLASTANSDAASYSARLNIIFANSSATTLHRLDNAGVTVCLDQRLTRQQHGWGSDDIEAVYYRGENMLTLPDNGALPAERWYQRNTNPLYTVAYTFIDQLGYDLSKGEMRSHDRYYATHWTQIIGGRTTTIVNHYDWQSPDNYGTRGVARNPWLTRAPAAR